MSHIPYTICRSGTYYYNRRVPKHAVSAYGSFIRQSLSQCPEEAAEYAKRLGNVLEASWRNTSRVQAIDIPTIIGMTLLQFHYSALEVRLKVNIMLDPASRH